MSEIPQAAIDAAAVAIHDADCPDTRCSGSALGHAHRLARLALEAAAPHVAAAQREADAQLAEAEARRLHERGLDEVSNAGEVMSAALEDFADLLRNPPEGDSDGT